MTLRLLNQYYKIGSIVVAAVPTSGISTDFKILGYDETHVEVLRYNHKYLGTSDASVQVEAEKPEIFAHGCFILKSYTWSSEKNALHLTLEQYDALVGKVTGIEKDLRKRIEDLSAALNSSRQTVQELQTAHYAYTKKEAKNKKKVKKNR